MHFLPFKQIEIETQLGREDFEQRFKELVYTTEYLTANNYWYNSRHGRSGKYLGYINEHGFTIAPLKSSLLSSHLNEEIEGALLDVGDKVKVFATMRPDRNSKVLLLLILAIACIFVLGNYQATNWFDFLQTGNWLFQYNLLLGLTIVPATYVFIWLHLLHAAYRFKKDFVQHFQN